MIRHHPRPTFDSPPVVEVALAVQFERIEGLGAAEMGLYWAEQRTRLPNTEQHLELDTVVERFEPQARASLRISSSDRPPSPRMWFLNDARTELIQIQRNKFIHNWREVPGYDKPYPRYEYIRDNFRQEFRAFKDFLKKEKLGRITPNQCEVTYVNHIVAGAGWETHADADKVLTVWSGEHGDPFLPSVEDARMGFRYVMRDRRGRAAGRLNVNFEPARSRTDDRPIFVLTLTARGEPAGVNEAPVMKMLDLGHEWIVRGFKSMTTHSMHDIWGLKHA